MIDEHQYDCIIIGGGISGISYAHYLHQQGKQVLILDKDTRVGGQVHSLSSRVDSNFWRELGAHTCYNSYTHLLGIVEDIERADLVQPLGKGSYVAYCQNKIKKLFGQVAIFELLCNSPKLIFSSKEGKTVREYFRNIVGKKNYDRLFSRLFRAVLSQSADEYPVQKFLKRRKGRNERFARKYTFRQGLTSLLDAIITHDHLSVKTNSEVIAINYNQTEKLYSIHLHDGYSFRSTHVAIATDPQSASQLLADLEPDASALLADIPLFESQSLNVIVPKSKLSLAPLAGIIPLSDEFLSAVSRDLVEDDNLRSFTFHFIKGAKAQSGKMNIITSILGISANDIVEQIEVPHILPSLRVRHLDIARQVDNALIHDRVFVVGNYFHGLSLEDCVQRSCEQAEVFIHR